MACCCWRSGGGFVCSPQWEKPRLQRRILARNPSGAGRRAEKRGARSSRGSGRTIKEEEVYNAMHGWKIRTRDDEQVFEIAGLRVPASVNTVETPHKEVSETTEAARKEEASSHNTRSVHKLLRVMGGKLSGKKLLSSSGMGVRPMMEVVRGAVFNILQARRQYAGCLPAGRWLDLYSGTGSVGIEALSRGCVEAHFIELDPWVVSNVLEPNLKAAGLTELSVIHKMRVEEFIAAQASLAEVKPFDYVSVTPPYELVHYPTLMEQLSTSPLVGEETTVIVEYPLKSKRDIPDMCGPLSKVIDRRYGRTHVAIYGSQQA